MTPALAEDALRDFHSKGWLWLRGLVPAEDTDRMCDQLWAFLARRGVDRQDPMTWKEASVRGTKKLRFDDHRSPDEFALLRGTLEELFAPHRPEAVPYWGRVLLTLPDPDGQWHVPHESWHFDHPYRRPGEILGVNVFLLLAELEPGGGGTCLLEGSPALADRMLERVGPCATLSEQSDAFRSVHPWIEGLKTRERDAERDARYLSPATPIDGVRARIVEITGAAGDVLITHPALFHALAANTSAAPRLMRTLQIRAASSNAANQRNGTPAR